MSDQTPAQDQKASISTAWPDSQQNDESNI
jgi:hypothetical protein